MEPIKSIRLLYNVLELMDIDIHFFMNELHNQSADTVVIHESISKLYYNDKAFDSIDILSDCEVCFN